MGFFRITFPSGQTDHVDKADCAGVEECAISMFGQAVKDLEEFGTKIEELTEEVFRAAMHPGKVVEEVVGKIVEDVAAQTGEKETDPAPPEDIQAGAKPGEGEGEGGAAQ